MYVQYVLSTLKVATLSALSHMFISWAIQSGLFILIDTAFMLSAFIILLSTAMLSTQLSTYEINCYCSCTYVLSSQWLLISTVTDTVCMYMLSTLSPMISTVTAAVGTYYLLNCLLHFIQGHRSSTYVHITILSLLYCHFFHSCLAIYLINKVPITISRGIFYYSYWTYLNKYHP